MRSELAAFVADLAGRLAERPVRAAWSTHLDYLEGAADPLRPQGADEVLDALRGLERFTALEAEVGFERFLDVVRRAIGTLRSEDVLTGRAGAFAAARRQRRRGQLAARIEFAPRLDPRRDRAGVPAARRARTRSCSTTNAQRSPHARRRRSRRVRSAATRRR